MPNTPFPAAGRGLPEITRRTLLAAPALALPLGAAVDGHSRILSHYQNWLAARAEWWRLSEIPGNEEYDDPRSLAAKETEYSEIAALLSLPPQTQAELAAFSHILWNRVGPTSLPDTDGFREEMREPGCRAMLAIWQATSGSSTYPV
ncbi:hypothetical protein FDP22_00875 [Paroceanicella profunda]|uniref:Uncharacterized protein n=1 Tax=Paroceanicella profunda TaxID=2579971 RepID=A0A5B8FFW5_9RHOB|nr:hypothetical protein [Paroceanicella profunda]QDL90471.1 hypothetical protein FDP22_00875 [Paroceanicella profunda]